MCIRIKRTRKLDSNWKYVGSGTFENVHGDRVHLGGTLLKMRESKPFFVDDYVFHKCCKVMGSKRRGLMLYAEYYREVNSGV